jgi:hypothetical protein
VRVRSRLLPGGALGAAQRDRHRQSAVPRRRLLLDPGEVRQRAGEELARGFGLLGVEAGTRCPAWIGVNLASRLPSPRAGWPRPASTTWPASCSGGAGRACSPAGRPSPCRLRLRSSASRTRLNTMLPWLGGTQPGARWRNRGRSGGTACGSSAMRSSGSTGRTPGRRSRPRSGRAVLPRRGNRQPGVARQAALVAVSHFAGQSSRPDGGDDVAQRQLRFRLVRPGHAVKLAQQASRGLSQ